MNKVNVGRVNYDGDVTKQFSEYDYLPRESGFKYSYCDYVELSSGDEYITDLDYDTRDYEDSKVPSRKWHKNNQMFICKSCNLPNECDDGEIQFCKYCGFKNVL